VAIIAIIITIIIIIKIVTLQGYVTVFVMVLCIVIPGRINESCFEARTSETTKRLLEIEN
jgi:uncharacterized membrane protein